ncbi:MAG: cupin domain-containing protein [Burkholderiales bacterium]|nr:cupin domain-containing protein [Burkholderiales bacterium]
MPKASWVYQLKNDPRGIARVLAEGIETSVFPGKQVMISVVRIAPNAAGSVHSHPEEQWGVLLEGSCTRIQDGEAVQCEVGDFWCSPGGSMHGIRGGPEGAVVLDIFSPPREEYKVAGSGFGAATVQS